MDGKELELYRIFQAIDVEHNCPRNSGMPSSRQRLIWLWKQIWIAIRALRRCQMVHHWRRKLMTHSWRRKLTVSSMGENKGVDMEEGSLEIGMGMEISSYACLHFLLYSLIYADQ
ncbi:uncharacterized protein LOC122055624 isoform X2 [Zingiber officinale]|uniref:uncharacterized protein LOC122055624 isoform X2 n=1 Tax=Zingiber officinale TaxID=94328 RepID=UPI001C4C0986|nr:uncharacterized protein LOC122055624 isoform X2 [Zingiber officinale]